MCPIAKETSAPRNPIPVGLHHAICYGVVDLGTQQPLPGSQFSKGPARKVMIMWEFPEERVELERDGRKVDLPRALSKEYTLSLHEKAALTQTLVSWRGKQFTDEEKQGFDLKNILGANCMINVTHKANGYEEVKAITPLPKGLPKKQPENGLVLFDIEQSEIPASIPEWIRKKILASDEKRSNGHDNGYDEPPPHTDEDSDSVPF